MGLFLMVTTERRSDNQIKNFLRN